MQKRSKLIYKNNSTEEFLPGFSSKFPYISSYVELDKYPEKGAPWHWHNTIELLYIKSGSTECHIAGEVINMSKGMACLINSNVLHMTRVKQGKEENVQLVHLFDTVFLSGEKGNIIEEKYISPVISNPNIECFVFSPNNPAHKDILEAICDSFSLDETAYGYEVMLRNKLSEIWMQLLEFVQVEEKTQSVPQKASQQIKQMMLYVQKHYGEKISIKDLANTSYLSERACYRVFQECIHMTPMEYIISYRLQIACQMLLKEEYSLTEICQSCGFGSSSYFGKVFKEKMGSTPLEFRKKWQNNDILKQK